MAWTTPETYTVGLKMTAAKMNLISDNLSYLYSNVPTAEFGVGDILNNSNTETTFATLSIAAGSLGTTGGALVEGAFVCTQTSGGAMNFTLRVKLGATTIFAVTQSHTNALFYPWQYRFYFANMESASAQRCNMLISWVNVAASQTTGGTAGMGMYHNTATENSANALTLAVTMQAASAHASQYIYHLGSRILAPLT